MGWRDRLEKTVTGFGGAALAPLGLAKDLAMATFDADDRDDEFNGLLETILGYTSEAAGQVADVIGPDEGLGALIGGLPEIVRKPVREAGQGLEWLYREGISEPISTVQYAAGFSGIIPTAGLDNPLDVLDPGRWREGYRRAQDTSPGRNYAATVLGANLNSDEELAQVRKNALFDPISGTFDASLRLGADPAVLLGKAAGAARRDLIVKPLTARTDLDQVMGSNRIAKVLTELEGRDASYIRDRFFPNLPNGDALSVLLAEADGAEKANVLRLAMGDRSQLNRLYETRADLASQLERAIGEQDDLLAAVTVKDNFATVNGLGKQRPPRGLSQEADDAFTGGLARLDDELSRSQAEIDRLYEAEQRTFFQEQTLGALRSQPRASTVDAARVAVTRSAFYQDSLYAAPLRKVFTVRPDRLIRVEEPDGDLNVTRWLKKTGWDLDSQDAWRSRYMAQADPESRAAVLREMEDAAITDLATTSGLGEDDLRTIMAEIGRGRQDAGQVLAGRMFDGEGRSKVSFKDDMDGTVHEIPLLVSQTANLIPLADMQGAKKALTRIGEIKRNNPAAKIPEEMLEGFYRYWKPAMLLRVGWTARSLIDAQLRIAAKVGAVSQMEYIGPGLRNTYLNRKDQIAAQFDLDLPVEERRKAVQEAGGRSEVFGTRNVGGYEIERSGGIDRANAAPELQMASSDAAFNQIIGQKERLADEKLRKATGQQRSKDPVKDAADYDKDWTRNVNDQIGRDLLARQFLEGKSNEEVMRWLRTPDGRRHVARLPRYRRSNLQETVGLIEDQVESYTLGDATIKAAALEHRATAKMLDDATAGEKAARPVIHGEVLKEALGQSEWRKTVDGFITSAYQALGTVPEDTLARSPFFDTLYNDEAARLINLLDSQAGRTGDRLTQAELKIVQSKARRYALDQVRKTLYDFGDQSDFAHSLRFLSPFYSAWQESWTKWAGLAVENPAFIAKMRLAWTAPERVGLVVDENGNELDEDSDTGDTITYPDGSTSTIGKERFVRLPIPKGMARIPGLGGLATQQEAYFSKKSANFIFQASPGFGPTVTVPVAEIVRDRPGLQESVKAVLPYGAGDGIIGNLLPSTARQALTANAAAEDRVFRNTALRILMDDITDFRTGKRTTVPSLSEAKDKAKQLYSVRIVASYVMPVMPGFKSPYQPYLDKYRRLRAQDPTTAEQRFLDEEGEEFFALTQSFTRSADGIPATVEAYQARGEYADIIAEFPDIGRLIIGDEAATGSFSSAVYQAQLAAKVGPDSDISQRGPIPQLEVEEGPNVRQGWIEFRRSMDLIENMRVERGLPNLRVSGAKDLAAAKKAVIDALAERFPEWYDKFAIVDRNAEAKKLKALRAVVADDRLNQRPDIQGLGYYMQARDVFMNLLAERDGAGGSADLEAGSNQDLAMAWETVRNTLAERMPAFSPVMYRYLDRDSLTAA